MVNGGLVGGGPLVGAGLLAGNSLMLASGLVVSSGLVVRCGGLVVLVVVGLQLWPFGGGGRNGVMVWWCDLVVFCVLVLDDGL